MQTNFIKLRRQVIEKDFSKMNDTQRKAILLTEGALLVLAGAGSGKTTVLINRIANLMRYGKAYGSERIFGIPDETELKALADYAAGRAESYPPELGRFLSIGAPRPWEILAITFTNKAANEIKERIDEKLGRECENIGDIWACTFHSACARILRRHASLLGYSSRFTIYDTDDSRRVMKECQRILGIDEKFLSHKSILAEISSAKDSLVSPDELYKDGATDMRKRQIADAYECYQGLLKVADAMDFDDLIVNTILLLQKNSEVLEYYQNKFKYIMVDEYQDTNHAQYRLIALLAAKHKNICVVGDDDQSIYRFRGATIENILNFENQYKNAVTIRLEQNYRSTQNILDAANAVISNNEQRKGKELWTANKNGDKITLSTSDDEISEGRYVAEKIMSLRSQGGALRDNAVLYRMNAQSNSIETALTRMGIPYRIIGGYRFYERKEIKDAMAYLAVVSNPSDNVRLRRIINEPKRGIGEKTVGRAAEIAADLGISIYEVIKSADEFPDILKAKSRIDPFVKMLDSFIKASGEVPLHELLLLVLNDSGYIKSIEADAETYADRAANLGELHGNIVRYSEENEDPTLNGFLEEISLMTDIDSYNADSDNVVLMTIHAAKGLEFNNVFLVGMEENIFPGIRSALSQTELEEERRLAYVGITRAKNRLYLTNARSRKLYGSTTFNPPSRFLREIPRELLEQADSDFKRFAGRGERCAADAEKRFRDSAAKRAASRGFSGIPSAARPAGAAVDDFSVGDTVLHKGFGKGVVITAKKIANDCMLEIAFEKAGTKKIMAKFAGIKKI